MATLQGFPEEVPDDHEHVPGSWSPPRRGADDDTVSLPELLAYGELDHLLHSRGRRYDRPDVQDWLRQVERVTTHRSVSTTAFVWKSVAMGVLAVSFLLLFQWLVPETLPAVAPTLGAIVLTNWIRLFWQWRH
ncbi:hypothetical protein UO65_5366 [Actinokineospora spheciospongiae]|uniref:Uncharacterized protein n=1 Tax=Actinokineospora spheciospongiae TaxID=909613 RepID=W7ISD4_9PSEU|nr:hypothetical protein [Actinokineospora spheciospongiae]EWC59336.1 hypothetical protein UO65_5366 [Actinokineospora spheciospongiae]